MKYALVLGAGGFIGSHLVKKLKSLGYWVRGVDLKTPEFSETEADDFIVGDLRDPHLVSTVMFSPNQKSETDIENSFDEVYQLAADMGGAGYIFSGNNDANVMHNSALINLNVVHESMKKSIKKVFYSSSACMYPAYNQEDPNNPKCSEESAYPAAPDSEYGWEKLFSERLYLAYARNYGLKVRIARFHNIYGPEGTWNNGKEKAPAAICRKVCYAKNSDVIDIWGDGEQTRSFLYIDECIDGVLRLMESDFEGPVNIGSDEMVTINKLVELAKSVGNKDININHIDGPLGVRGRNSDNTLIFEKLNWRPNYPLKLGIEKTYKWIFEQINKDKDK
jgi:GDP-D-mannose 3',5'-epimerase